MTQSDDYKRGYGAGYIAGVRASGKDLDMIPVPPPWAASANGAWNGDMFADWLSSPMSPGDPYEKMHIFLNRVIRHNRLHVLEEIKAALTRLESEELGDYHD